MKLIIMQFFPTFCHFISLRSKYSPQHPLLPFLLSLFIKWTANVAKKKIIYDLWALKMTKWMGGEDCIKTDLSETRWEVASGVGSAEPTRSAVPPVIRFLSSSSRNNIRGTSSLQLTWYRGRFVHHQLSTSGALPPLPFKAWEHGAEQLVQGTTLQTGRSRVRFPTR
jgi:hypothetical protein